MNFCIILRTTQQMSEIFVHIFIKHGASLHLKFEGLNLSIVIIFKIFHWLKNDESYSVVSVALLRVSLLLRQRKVILCCCETTFLVIAELPYSLTYQIIISPIPLTPDFAYTHFAHKNYLNQCYLMHFTLHLQSL